MSTESDLAELIKRGEALEITTAGPVAVGRSTEVHSVDKAGFALWCADCADYLDDNLAEGSPHRHLVARLPEMEATVEAKEYVLQSLRAILG